jgi:hypothetical protein
MAEGKVITVRNVSPQMARRLKALAESSGTSVNATILRLLDQSLGLHERRKRLEEHYATWTKSDFQEFQDALQAQRTIDDDLWR